MRTGLVERHLRRFIWRVSEDAEWQDYAIDRVHFGDQSAACQLEVAKGLIAELGREINEQHSGSSRKTPMWMMELLGGARRKSTS